MIRSGEGEDTMGVLLHHVSLVTTDPERSAEFYQSIFGLTRLDRPPFKIEGVWLDCGPAIAPDEASAGDFSHPWGG